MMIDIFVAKLFIKACYKKLLKTLHLTIQCS